MRRFPLQNSAPRKPASASTQYRRNRGLHITATDHQSRKETNQQSSVIQPVQSEHSDESKHESVSAIKAVTEADNQYRNADPLLMMIETTNLTQECNAATERQNRTLATSLRMYCHDNQSTWPDYLQGVMMSFRNTIQTESTQYSPYYLVFGREPRNPIDIALIPESTKGLSKDAESALKLIVDNLTLGQKN
ncbi:Hypothetical predicted protein [Mytilus galloprovincialis]|uniref:Uncharacterized protein n=1 Tax=Mytilus galloprovincialis TaxID=29158 RepID=A0A8B6CAC2_MYTGA|nr:Hypothetical predicted protein [Mytilus galloprovincialis]